MVRIYILTFLLLLANFAIGQTVDSTETKMIIYFDETPAFNGDIIDFIQSKIIYPESAINDSKQGVVYVSFCIDTAGETKNHEVIRGIREDLNFEALRVSKLIRFEKPALQRGKPVEVKFTVPIKFNLHKLKSRGK